MSVDGQPLVDIRGARLRTLRETARMRLEDIASAAGISVATVHRIEKCVRRRVAPATLCRIAATLGVSASIECCTAAAWVHALREKGLQALLRWEFEDAARMLGAEDLVAAPQGAGAELEGEILRAWTLTSLGHKSRADVFEYLAIQARGHGNGRACVWALLLAGILHAFARDSDGSVSTLSRAARAAHEMATLDDQVLAHAALGRQLLRAGQRDRALAVLLDERACSLGASPYPQARWRQAQAMVYAALGHHDRAEQASSAAVSLALLTPNFRLAATVERMIACVWQARGQMDKADQATVRAARFYARAGKSDMAIELWSDVVMEREPDGAVTSAGSVPGASMSVAPAAADCPGSDDRPGGLSKTLDGLKEPIAL